MDMDKDEALRDVQEIKQVMHETRKPTNDRELWAAIAYFFAVVVIVGLIPILAPVVAVGFIVGGVIEWRRNSMLAMRVMAICSVVLGILILTMTYFVISGHLTWSVNSIIGKAATSTLPTK